MPTAAARTGAGFGGLSRYLLTGSDGKNPDRVAWTATRNLPSELPQDAPRVMAATALQHSRIRKPVYHLSINWPVEDQPTPAQMEAAVDRLLKDLKLDGHQALLVAHRDTAHPHVHVMVNRVHPETRKAWSQRNDWERIEKALRGIERDMGWRVVPGRNSQLAHAGTQDAHRLRKLAWEPMHTSHSWAELEDRLHERGLALRARGRGLVITDGKLYIKASEVHRSLSRAGLEERFEMRYSDWRQEVRRVQKLAKDHRRLASRVSRQANPRRIRARWIQARSRANDVRTAVDGSGDMRIVEAKITAFAVRYGMAALRRVSPAAATILQGIRMMKRVLDRERER